MVGSALGFALMSAALKMAAREVPTTMLVFFRAILPESLIDLALAIGTGLSLPRGWYIPMVSTGVLIVIFIALAIVRWGREEF